MKIRRPIEPLLVTHLIPEMRNELIRVLESLSDDEWNRPTVCEGWSVRDVALHILGDDMGLLSNLRDHDGQHHTIDGWEALVAFINARNQAWVTATRRLSRKLLMDLLRFTGQQVYELFTSIDPYSLGGPVGWAGDAPDPMWLHIARELTEYWTHHQHICEAVGRTSLKEARYIQPVLATFVHALPRTFSTIDAPLDTLVKFVITGDGGGAWHVVREVSGWMLYAETNLDPVSTVSLDTDSAWRLFTKNRSGERLKPHIVIAGDSQLGESVLNTVAIIAKCFVRKVKADIIGAEGNMPKRIELHPFTDEEQAVLKKLSRSRTAAKRAVERATILLLSAQREPVGEIAACAGCRPETVLHVVKRFNDRGLASLEDSLRSGRPPIYDEQRRGQMIATAKTHPQQLGLPYGHWTLDRLTEYVNQTLQIPISRSQLGEILEQEGLKWYQEKTYFTESPDPQLAEKRGRS